MLPEFELLTPQTLPQALDALAEGGPDAAPHRWVVAREAAACLEEDAILLIEPGQTLSAVAFLQSARQAGFKLSITMLLGIAGRERSRIHAQETGRVLSAIDPEYVGALSLMLIPGTPLFEDYENERMATRRRNEEQRGTITFANGGFVRPTKRY